MSSRDVRYSRFCIIIVRRNCILRVPRVYLNLDPRDINGCKGQAPSTKCRLIGRLTIDSDKDKEQEAIQTTATPCSDGIRYHHDHDRSRFLDP